MFTRRRLITAFVVALAFAGAMVMMSLILDFIVRLESPDVGGAAPPAAAFMTARLYSVEPVLWLPDLGLNQGPAD